MSLDQTTSAATSIDYTRYPRFWCPRCRAVLSRPVSYEHPCPYCGDP